MEIQKAPGLDFEELGLVSRVVIPQKFKVSVFPKYDGYTANSTTGMVVCIVDEFAGANMNFYQISFNTVDIKTPKVPRTTNNHVYSIFPSMLR